MTRVRPVRGFTLIETLLAAALLGALLLALNFFVEDAQSRFESVADTAVLRNWTKDVLLPLAWENALEPAGLFGGFAGEPFEPETSPDLIVLLRKA